MNVLFRTLGVTCEPPHASVTPRRFRWHFRYLLRAAALAGLLVTSGLAASTSELRHAVAASGAVNVESATPAQFIKAFNSVAVRLPKQALPDHISVSINLRPDLAAQITVAALQIPQKKMALDNCDWVEPIIRAALAAAPSAKHAILHAALAAEPEARECILAAAGSEDAEAGSEFFRPAGVDAGSVTSSAIGTINPGNFSGQGSIVSPFHP